MLTAYDDLPCHQTPQTFDQVATSDPRFFDRYWFAIYDPKGRFALATGLGVYRNGNVLDGFAAAVIGGKQHNIRVSRVLRPDFTHIGAGPLKYDIIEGLRTFRLQLAPNEHNLAFDLVWTAIFPAFEEAQHLRRYAGFLEEDYHRYRQFGEVSGWIEIAGERFDCADENFFAYRDRSFGVRPGIGGPLPPRGPELGAEQTGAPATLRNGFAFLAGDIGGNFQHQEDHLGRTKFRDGTFVSRDPSQPHEKLKELKNDIFFRPDTLHWRHSEITIVTSAHRTLEIVAEPLCNPFVYQGFGYYDGYQDHKGLGAYRGQLVIEGDRYDVSNPEQVIDESGCHQFPPSLPLEYPCRFTCNGVVGYADSMLGLLGPHPRFEWKGGAKFETF